MSWSPAWAPSALSPNRNSSLFDPCPPRRDRSWSNAQTAELLKFSMNLTNFDRHSLGTSVQLPPIYGPIGLRRSPLPSFAGLPPIVPSAMGCHPPSFARKSSHADYPLSSARHSLPSPMDSTYFCSPAEAGPKPNQLIRPFDEHPYSSPVPSPHPALCSHPAYSSNPPKRSKAALATEDWDHPSFARPPHRAVTEPKLSKLADFWRPAGSPMDLNPAHQTPSVKNQALPISDEPLVPNVYPVPPPPPYEQSAAPLSDLAADIVWERCYFPKPRASSTVAAAPWESAFSWSTCNGFHSVTSPASHKTQLANPSSSWAGGSANSFGVIGAEAKARRFNRQYPSSVSPPQSDRSNSPAHCRKQSIGTKMEVKPAFRRWTRQVLEQTLLSPQVLILALYYIDSVAGTDVFGDANGKMSLLPYKMLLAALVVANKTLDDHSYRNSTFANVSSMTNAEVNAIEVALLKALKFDVAPSCEQWTNWLKEVIAAGERSGLLLPELGPPSPISPLSTPQFSGHPEERSSQPHFEPSYPAQHGSIFDQAPTPEFHWHPSQDPRGSSVLNHGKPFAPAPIEAMNNELRFHPAPVAPLDSHREFIGSSAFASEFTSSYHHHGSYFPRTYSSTYSSQ
ncbi:hypothetical protein PGT21_007343 [Puccinia graminis f. sp. tritici]|uniref:Cyclin N-terminal domain-containing protein n=2 Tax=Puccinia graminis f. sp. tritici TaxID=56615 RepID=E3JVZ1_PUCGT|nr:uncharacterized protein PGTG_02657 [Puccinia graminis f. sp. tritici CRL 75-36-700-3]EFP76216.1 hypothetical protein PGTG_02657 [Puccinia graminis f. sp. tritici CRL 75-36-700-3]KAA1117436.1 hypothetical protein PGT21_007343 [Puccinia graminis f. sp. tritici]